MTFVASDPLSELVWSPHKGLSLKCADCNLVDKKSSLLWDVGPNDMILLPSESIRSRGNNDDKQVDEGNVIMSPVAFHAESEISGKARLVMAPRGSAGGVFGSSAEPHTGIVGRMEEVSTGEEGFVLRSCRESRDKVFCRPKSINKTNMDETSENTAGQENENEASLLKLETIESRPDLGMIEPSSGKSSEEGMIDRNGVVKNIDCGGQVISLSYEVHTVKQQEAVDNPMSSSPGRRQKEMTLDMEEESKDKVKIGGFTNACPLEKLEFTAENDSQHLVSKDAIRQSEGRPPEDESFPHLVSPVNCRILRYQRKGKKKVSSDGDIAEGMSKHEDDSHESMESCSSAGFISKGKKRQTFEQQLISGSKRIKKQVEESPASSSLAREDSSFMNWISNMVKGSVTYNKDKASSLALTRACPSQGQESHDPKMITCGKNHNSGSGNTGFHTMFQSMYSPRARLREMKMSSDDYPFGGSKELVLTDKTCDAIIAPISCHGENDESCKKYLGVGEKFTESAIGNDEGPSTHPLTVCANVATTWDTYKTPSVENVNSINLACYKPKDGVSTSTSLDKHMTNHFENKDLDPLSKGKAIDNVGYRSAPLGNLWIARFSAQMPSPMMNLNQCNQSSYTTHECSDGCTRLIPPVQNCLDFPIDQKSSGTMESFAEDSADVLCKELQKNAPSTDAFFGFKKVGEHKYQSSIYKLNPILPSQKSSEAMASIFARRLDALKHINTSDVKDDATPSTITCFFCGRSGHDLRDCSKIADTDMEDLLRNARSYSGAKNTPCLCIKCFQLDHWAITCPVTSSSRQQLSEHGAALFNYQSSSKLHLCSMWETKENHCLVDGENIICHGQKPQREMDHSVKKILDEKMISNRRIRNLDNVQMQLVSSSEDNKFKANLITPLCNFISKQISNVPKGMFDSIRRLWFSRTDVLKLMNSHISLSCLNGFFLRLRLGKWEEGLGGTGYYVACITGVQSEKSPETSKNLIFVNVVGMKCLVQSQYVSNHDFLEEEILAWWSAISSTGSIPSEEDLKSKFEDRKKLGF